MVTSEGASWCKLAKFVSHHIFSDEDGDVFFSVINGKRLFDKGWIDGLTTRPSLDDFFFARLLDGFDLLEKVFVDERSFFR